MENESVILPQSFIEFYRFPCIRARRIASNSCSFSCATSSTDESPSDVDEEFSVMLCSSKSSSGKSWSHWPTEGNTDQTSRRTGSLTLFHAMFDEKALAGISLPALAARFLYQLYNVRADCFFPLQRYGHERLH